jgi:ATP/maltotriose-dependent transcriptional regulator MalT
MLHARNSRGNARGPGNGVPVRRLRHLAGRGPASLNSSAQNAEQPSRQAEPAQSPFRQAPPPLTGRELEVLRLLAAGGSNQRIAHDLVVALETVKST